MVYEKQTWANYAAGGTPLSAERLAHMETQYDEAVTYGPTAYLVKAPAPSGDTSGVTDTATLQALVDQAQDEDADALVLQSGTYYVTSLFTGESFTQPKIVGQGMKKTTLNVVGTGSGIKFVGGSGQPSGAVCEDMTIYTANAGGTCLEFEGIIGGQGNRIRFDGIGRGVLFANTKSGDFTEFCVIRGSDFRQSLAVDIEYVRTGGNDSFHGTGFEDCVFNQASGATTPKIKIGSGCRVYNAPFAGTFFLRAGTAFASLASGASDCSTFGDIRTESNSSSGITSGSLLGNRVLTESLGSGSWTHAGGVQNLTQGTGLGVMRLAYRVQFNDDGTLSRWLQPTEYRYAMATGANTTFGLGQATTYLVSVTLIGTNYEYNYLLYAWRNFSDNNGAVTTLANPRSFNTAGYGAPTFTVSSSSLVITNASFPASGVRAIVSVTETSGPGRNQLLQL